MINNLISTFILIYIILILGYILGSYLSKTCAPLREGARTLPRPVINPRVNEDIKEKKKPIFIPGETINQMIDRFIFDYFNKDGFALESTIELYTTVFCNKGNIDPENKRKLTDIGYYYLNIVIPNIPSTSNPEPKEYWPPIKWSNHSIFNLLQQPTQTLDIIRGQNYKDMYVSNYSGSNTYGWNMGSLFSDGESAKIETDGSSNNQYGNNRRRNNNLLDKCRDDPKNSCGIGCPTSCLSSVFASALNDPRRSSITGSSSRTGDNNDTIKISGEGRNRQNMDGKQNLIPNTTFLPGGVNELIIGSANIDGYQITDCKQTSDSPDLNNMINRFINTYFIESGPNQGRPTQEAIDQFQIFKNKAPMDGFHMNKMRDLVYYILQVIIPGLPTEDSGRSYVEWRPIRWLSLSEKTKL